MSHMLDEIREQPEIVRTIINTLFKSIEELRREIERRPIRFAYIAARGTSENAAYYAKYLFEIEHGIPVALAAPSVFTVYGGAVRFGSDMLVLGISSSGSAPDVLAVMETARAAGALTVAITNRGDSPLAQVSDFALVTPAGEELSVTATKTYTATIAVLALLSTALTPDRPERLEHLRRTADVMEKTLQLDDALHQLVSRYKNIQDCVVIGRGYNRCTARECAHEITQTCSVSAKAYSAADFLHGAIALVREGFPVILLAPDGKAYPFMADLYARLKKIHPAVIAFAHNPDFLCGTETAIRVPGNTPEWLSPLVYAVAGQLFAHWLSVVSDHDPDRPRGLSRTVHTK